MKQKLIIFVLILTLFLPLLFANAGTILSTYKYAWGSNVGYINFENVIVSDTALSGFAWSENTGWIKFDPVNGGVLNDGNGNLSGFAWGEGLGWIDFSNVSISTSTGRFHGTASGDAVGVINFDCPSYCDVRTDWTTTPAPVPSPAPTQTSGGGRSSRRINTNIPTYVESINSPLIVFPEQSGTLKQDTTAGVVTIDVPAGLQSKITFIINEDLLNSNNSFLLTNSDKLVNNSFYDVLAYDESGNPVHYFNKPIKISLPIAENQRGKNNLELYWLNEVNWSWVLIPDAIFTSDKVTFYVNHLTRFGIFEDVKSSAINKKAEPNISLPQENKVDYIKDIKNVIDNKPNINVVVSNNYRLWLLLLLTIVAIFLWRRKK